MFFDVSAFSKIHQTKVRNIGWTNNISMIYSGWWWLDHEFDLSIQLGKKCQLTHTFERDWNHQPAMVWPGIPVLFFGAVVNQWIIALPLRHRGNDWNWIGVTIPNWPYFRCTGRPREDCGHYFRLVKCDNLTRTRAHPIRRNLILAFNDYHKIKSIEIISYIYN